MPRTAAARAARESAEGRRQLLLHEMNHRIKNVLAAVVNGVAGVVFIIVSQVDWPVAIAIAVGSVLGAQLGARVGRRLPPTVYRVVIVAVGVAAIVNLLR